MITILECDLLSPVHQPDHCPPGVVWVMTLHDERIKKIRLVHPLPALATATHREDPMRLDARVATLTERTESSDPSK
jgi:hypothetical protein